MKSEFTKPQYLPSRIFSNYISSSKMIQENPAVLWTTKNPMYRFYSLPYLWRMMESDPVIGSALDKRVAAGLGDDWDVITESESPKDLQMAKDLKRLLTSLGMNEARRRLAYRGIGRGISTVELVWGMYEGLQLPQMVSCPEWYFVFDGDENMRVRTKETPDGEIVEKGKVACYRYRYQRFEQPYGVGVLLDCYWAYTFGLLCLETMSLASRAMPLPFLLGKYDISKPAEKEALDDQFQKMGYEFYLLVGVDPNGALGDPVQAVSGQTGTHEALLKDFYNILMGEKLISILGQQMTTAVQEIGARSLGETQAEEYYRQKSKPDSERIDGVVNEQIMALVCEWNFGEKDLFKVHTRITKPKDLLGIVKVLSEAGKMVDIGTKYIYDALEIPEPAETDEKAKQAPASNPFGGMGF